MSGPSTKRDPGSRWVSGCAGASRLLARPADCVRRRRAEPKPGQAAYSNIMESNRATRGRPDARHRRHHPAGTGQHRAGWPQSIPRVKARPAPERPPSACTAPPTCSMRSASSWPVPECSWWDRTTVFCPTSQTCCLLSVRSTRRRPRSPRWLSGKPRHRPRVRQRSDSADQG